MMKVVFLASAAGAALVALNGSDSPPSEASVDPVARGRYLVTAFGCADCHTPLAMTENGPVPDEKRAFSGHPETLRMPAPPAPAGPWIVSVAGTNTAWAGPWGVSYTSNLTPDADTGLGKWTEQEFTDALRSGRHLGRGRPILPPMPWQSASKLTDEDLHSVFAYLKSLPPIQNRVPEPEPPASAR